MRYQQLALKVTMRVSRLLHLDNGETTMTTSRTIFDLIRTKPTAAVLLVHRHASYLMGPVRARYANDAEAYTANYAEKEPPCLFLVDEPGIQRSRQQGRQFAEAGITIAEIVASHQGRGHDTAMRLSEGHFQAPSRWVPVRCDVRADYPRYHHDPLLECLSDPSVGDRFVAEWLNGKRSTLVRSDTPEGFEERTMSVVNELLSAPGVRVMSCHFENVTLVHGLIVDGRDLGTIREDWFPTKSGGVVIVRQPDGSQDAFDYTPDLTLMG